MMNYLIELAVVHVTLFFGYWLFLRKEQQYARMRSYLISSTMLALAIPLLELPRLFLLNPDPLVMMPVEVMSMNAVSIDTVSIAPAARESGWGYEFVIWTYVTICACLMLKFISSIAYLIWLERKSRREKVNGVIIRRVGNIKGSFTFFNWIFVSNEIDPQHIDYHVILQHEKAHASKRHTYDLVFFELFKACFWWLPTAWIMLEEIKKIHEYQADAVAIKTCDVDRYSSILISSTLKTNGLILTSAFDDTLLLKRLRAMKQPARNVGLWKLASLSALCGALFIVLACSEEKSFDANVVEVDAEFEGGPEAFHNFIRQEITYPLQARQAGVEGRVDVEFVVDKDGSISMAEAITRIGAGCGEEAARAVRTLPRFRPATQNGKRVRVRMVVPIVFQLKAGETNSDNSAQGMVIIGDMQSRNYKLTVESNYENGEWTGTVYDQWWEALPGANIVVPGTTARTTSAEDGTFKLKAEEGYGIVVTFVGYETPAIIRSLWGQPKNWLDIANHPKISRDSREGSHENTMLHHHQHAAPNHSH